MSDKVQRGTPKTVPSICLSCRRAQVIRGLNFEHEIYCTAVAPTRRMAYPLSECSIFDDKSQPALYEMHQIAWVVKSRNRGPMGFADGNTLEITVEPPENPNIPQQPTTGYGKI